MKIKCLWNCEIKKFISNKKEFYSKIIKKKMTAETLKPFINVQTSKIQSEKYVKNLTFFILSSIIVIFCIGLSCFMVGLTFKSFKSF